MGILSGLFRSWDAPKDSTAGSAHRFSMGGSNSGKQVNERSAIQMTTVYSCVWILSEAVAGLPLHNRPSAVFCAAWCAKPGNDKLRVSWNAYDALASVRQCLRTDYLKRQGRSCSSVSVDAKPHDGGQRQTSYLSAVLFLNITVVCSKRIACGKMLWG